MRLLITGATGYLGTELRRRARAAGYDVEAVSTRDFDVRDRAAVARALAAVRPDAVVHTAYRQDGPDFRAINVEGSATVAGEASRVGTRLIHLSTDVVFDGRRGAYVETDEPCPVTAYGASKAMAERAVAEACPAALIVRTSLVYGGPSAPPSKHELAAHDPTITFFTDEIRCPVQVSDLASALLELVALECCGILHVAGADGLSRCDFARLVAGEGVRCAPSTSLGLVRPLDCTLDSSRARALLRTRLRGAREVLHRQ